MSHDNPEELCADEDRTAPAASATVGGDSPDNDSGELAVEVISQQVTSVSPAALTQEARPVANCWRRSAPVGTWLAGIVAAVIAAVLAPILLAQMEQTEPKEPLPLTVAVVVVQDATIG